MFGLSLAFLAGISVLQGFSALPDVCWLALGFFLPALLADKAWLRLPAMAVAGFLWAWLHAVWVLDQQLPVEFEGADLLVEGRVQGLPERLADHRLRFGFLVQRVYRRGQWRSFELPVRLSWYRESPELHAGERWQLRVRLKQPHGFANPGSFDYERWLFAHRIRATGYVRHVEDAMLLQAADAGPVQLARQTLATFIGEQSGFVSDSGLIAALGIGDRSGMSNLQWEVLRKTGTSHLMAISGLHVGLVATLVFFVTRKLWCLAGVPGHWPAPRVAAVFALLAALVYALLSGFQVPAQRAFLMVAVWMMAVLWHGRPDPWRVWSLALLVVLVVDPLSVLTAGFWLSFGAVAWLLYLGTGRHASMPRWKKAIYLQAGLITGLTPLLWVWFGQLSLVAPLANLVAIPWTGFLLVPPLLLGLLFVPLFEPVATLFLQLAGFSLEVLWQLLEWLADLPDIVWYPSALPAGFQLLMVVAIAGLLAPRFLPVKLPALVLLIPIALYQQERPKSGDLWFTLLDVGQGLAVVVETRHHVLVYDTGPSFRSGLDSGEAVVAPYLRSRGYAGIDTLVISHSDNDHAGGSASLLKRMDIADVVAGEPGQIDARAASACRSGQRWIWDGVGFDMLSPATDKTGNDASCVLRIETGHGIAVLLPGDIEKATERQLLQSQADRLQADILVAPHHGSRTSSTAGFIAAVQPQVVLFPVGYRNRFGFPKKDVVNRYRLSGAQMMQTAQTGAIRIRLERHQPLQPVGWRESNRHYWNRQAEPGSPGAIPRS